MKPKQLKKEQKSFKCHALNKVQLTFPNGNWVSTIWGSYTYSDNYDVDGYNIPMESDTCEIMFTCPEKLEKKILKKYGGGQPIGYLKIEDWLKIIKLLSN